MSQPTLTHYMYKLMQAGANVQVMAGGHQCLSHSLNFQDGRGNKDTSESWEYNQSVRQVVQSGVSVLLMSSAVVVWWSSRPTSIARPLLALHAANSPHARRALDIAGRAAVYWRDLTQLNVTVGQADGFQTRRIEEKLLIVRNLFTSLTSVGNCMAGTYCAGIVF